MGIRMTNIATPMPQLRAKFTSKLGIPLSGCKVYTYEPNSDIPKTTWIDIDKTVENTNPVLLDAAGEADIYLDGLYRIVVKDRFGFVIYDVEKTGYEQPIFNDGLLLTWSGRTQEQKNKDNPSLFDFNAKGDGVTDDTQAFLDLELDCQGHEIDLYGLTYKVSQDFNGNKYKNGTLKISADIAYVKSTPMYLSDSYQIGGNNGFEVANFRAKHPTDTFANSSRTILQGLVFDVVNNCAYGQTTFSGTAGVDETSRILKYENNAYPLITDPVKSYDCGTTVGHQGLGLTYKNGQPVFWSTCGTAQASRALYVSQFELDDTNNNIKNIKYFQVFNATKHVLDASRCMAISPSGDLLAVTNATQIDNAWIVRIFKTDIFTATGDYSGQYLHEFQFSKQGRSVQSIAINDKHVYILHGGSYTTGSVLEIRTLEGVLVCLDASFRMGYKTLVDRSNAGQSTTFYEDEVLTFVPCDGSWVFGCLVATGRTDNWQNNSLLTFQKPVSLPFKSSNILEAQIYRVARKGTPYIRANNLDLDNSTAPEIGKPLFQLQPSLRTSNTDYSEIIRGQFQCWYEPDKSTTWNLFASNPSNGTTAQVQLFGATGFVRVSKLSIATVSVYSDNTTAKAGGLVAGDVYRTATGQLMIVY